MHRTRGGVLLHVHATDILVWEASGALLAALGQASRRLTRARLYSPSMRSMQHHASLPSGKGKPKRLVIGEKSALVE